MEPQTPQKQKRISLRDETRKMVYDVYMFMLMEAKNGIQIDLKAAQKRTAAATAVCPKTVRKIVNEIESGVVPANRTPAGTARRKRGKKVTAIQSYDQGVIRRIIHNFQRTESKSLTVQHLLERLRNQINFKGGPTSLRRVLMDLGFKWKQAVNNKGRVLIEHTSIRLKRIQYLRHITKFRDERPIVYVGVFIVNSTHTIIKPEIRKGYAPHLMAIVAGYDSNLVPAALLTFSLETVQADYDVSPEFFEQWISSQLFPKLPQYSTVVISTTPYTLRYSNSADKAPKSTSKRSDMELWLQQRGIEVNPSMLKPQLYQIICSHKKGKQNYAIDELLIQNDFPVLRLPPKHPDLNPVELAWPLILSYIAEKNEKGDVEMVKAIIEERLRAMDGPEWQSICQTVRNTEEEYRGNDMAIDTVTDSIVIEETNDLEHEKNSDNENTDDDDLR